MIAGLPKLRFFVVGFLFLMVSFVALGQEIQTPSSVLEEVIEIVWSNPVVSSEQAATLSEQILTVVNAEVATPEEILAMLEDQLGWSQISDPEQLAIAIEALDQVFLGLVGGEIAVGEGALALTDAWIDLTTPDGVIRAIESAAVRAFGEDIPEGLTLEASQLIADGVPPGIVLRVTKAALRDGEDPLEALAALESASEDESWGQAANEVTGQGQNKYQEEETEQNANENQTAPDEPESEQERNDNAHGQNPGNGSGSNGASGSGSGSSNGNGKKD
ncbi:hypothetical protein JW848_04315 [Candidatus Bipolaricaulota bacterium]|nr:hypothetical protein [Candidatus Bipolaricaulota bacterium]